MNGRLLLVDDHVVVREGLKRVLEATADGWHIVDASSGSEALDRLRQQAFDLAIVDLSMPGIGGLELIGRIKAHWPKVAVLVLSMHAEDEYALRAFQSGANGYITKDRAPSELVDAVRKVLQGGAYVTASLAERVVMQLNGTVRVPRHAQLSNRELEVLRRIVRGQRLTEIADALSLSVKTISTHKTRIQDKLQVDSTAALIRYGMEQGLHVDPVQAER